MSELLKINVNDHTERKGKLTYLSWAWAWAEVLKIDPKATWEAHEFNGLPFCVLPDTTAIVKVSVTLNEHTKSCLLPVMNHQNKAITEPDAFAINTALMRCLAKAIAMHGLGLYIYAGEDLPEEDGDSKLQHRKGNERPATTAQRVAFEIRDAIKADKTLAAVEKYQATWEDADEGLTQAVWSHLTAQEQDYLTAALDEARKAA